MKNWRKLLLASVCAYSCIVMSHAAKAQESRTGIACHFTWWSKPEEYDRTARLIAESGAGWARDGVTWRNVEYEKGKYRLSNEVRQWVAACRKHNVNVIMLINATTHGKGTEKGTGFYDDVYDPDAFAAYAAYVAKELPEVTHFEIMNEPANFGYSKYYGGMWNGMGDSPWVAQYVVLLNKAAAAIKAVRPDAKVAGLGSVAPVNFRQLAMGVSPQVDAIVDHPYSFRQIPELVPFTAGHLKRDGIITADEKGTFASQIRMYREQSAKHNGPKQFWLTEWGYSTYQPVTKGMYAGFTPSAQAKYLQRRVVECMGLGIEISVIYDLKNDGRNINDAENNFGLLDADWKPKPSYYALQKVNKIMSEWQAASWGEIKVKTLPDRADRWPIVWDDVKMTAPGDITTYQFNNGKNQQAFAVWSTERADGDLLPRAADFEISATTSVKKVEAVDMMTDVRTTLKFEKNGNMIILKKITVPDSPVLVVMSSE